MFQPVITTNGMVQFGSDANALVEFRMEPILQGHETEMQGRPIFKDVPFINLRFAGANQTVWDRPATEADKQRFKAQWEAFQRGEEQVSTGTPLKMWPLLSRSQVAELAAFGITTVDQLAAIGDNGLEALGLGGRTLRDQAQSWLRQAADGAELMKVQAENNRLRDDLEALKKQFSEFSAERQAKRSAA